MKIVIPTIGSRGDVQPYINLAQGLQDAGYNVILATNPTLRPLVEQHGVRAASVGTAMDMGMEGERLLEKSFDNMCIVIPHIIDQYYWGQRVFELGVGPKYFTRAHMSSVKLAQSITQALTDAVLRRKSAELGDAIRNHLDGGRKQSS